MSKAKKKACIQSDCVACGCCMKVCPVKAISIPHGIIAIVDSQKCIGCGKCRAACPAGVIELMERKVSAA